MENLIYIVTGAAGHLGSHVVQELLSRGKRVRALFLPEEKCPDFINKNRHLLTEYTGDLLDLHSLKRLFYCVQPVSFIIIHCAAFISILKNNAHKVYDVNIKGTGNLLEICREFLVSRFIYISSVHAIPLLPHGQTMCEVHSFDPDRVSGHYSKSKAIATQLVLDESLKGLNAVVVHPSGIIGPHGLLTGNMMKMISLFVKGRFPFTVKGGYDFVDVRDVTSGVLAAAEKGKTGECYILSNRFIDLKELFDTLYKAGAKHRVIAQIPMWVAKMLAPLAEFYYRIFSKTPLLTRFSLKTLLKNGKYSHEKANRELGYKTRPVAKTLEDTVQWIK